MEATLIVTDEMLHRLPASEGFKIGDEIEVEYSVEWNAVFGTMWPNGRDGEAVISEVTYKDIDLTDLCADAVELDGEVEEEARVDAIAAYGDYLYECAKDREFERD